jgi:ABC-type transport system involved in multi-copper enzyme maturation permease subunit
MNITSANSISRVLGLSRLTGPIFSKELRVSSRRRRNYILRLVYLIFLTAFLTMIWLDAVSFTGVYGTYVVSRMAQAGKQIVVTLVWFQFYATQIVAVVMLSTAISDEIYHRTLGVLMTTPVTSFQIVMGKLSGKLLQLVLLLAVSLPVLAVVRVFGGVPWEYILSSLCMTLTALVFVGSLSLFFSTFSSKAYVVIILTLAALGLLFGLPLLFVTTQLGRSSWHTLTRSFPLMALCHVNPCAMLNLSTVAMLDPRWVGRVHFSWPIHCGIMVTASALVLLASVYLVRKVALAQAAGQRRLLERLQGFWIRRSANKTVTTRTNARIRRVKGPPVVWKELISRISSREKLIVAVVIGLEVAMIVAMYLFPVVASSFGYEETHILYIWVFMGMGMLSATVLPSTCITSEKESRSWPLLLTTTLSDWDILFGKFIGVLRRSVFLWLLLFVYVGLFWIYQYVGPLAFVHLVLLIAGTVVFLCGTGFYFSSRLKRTSEAVITNIVFAASLWGLVPLLLELLQGITRGNYFGRMVHRSLRDLGDWYLGLIPFVQAQVLMVSTFSQSVWSSYRWPDRGRDSLESTCFMFIVMVGYVLVGWLFAWRGTRRFRRNIF